MEIDSSPDEIQPKANVRALISAFENNVDGEIKLKSRPRTASLGNMLSKNVIVRVSEFSTLDDIDKALDNVEQRLNQYEIYNKAKHVEFQEELFNILTNIINIDNDDPDKARNLIAKTKIFVSVLNTKLPSNTITKNLYEAYSPNINQTEPIQREPINITQKKPEKNITIKRSQTFATRETLQSSKKRTTDALIVPVIDDEEKPTISVKALKEKFQSIQSHIEVKTTKSNDNLKEKFQSKQSQSQIETKSNPNLYKQSHSQIETKSKPNLYKQSHSQIETKSNPNLYKQSHSQIVTKSNPNLYTSSITSYLSKPINNDFEKNEDQSDYVESDTENHNSTAEDQPNHADSSPENNNSSAENNLSISVSNLRSIFETKSKENSGLSVIFKQNKPPITRFNYADDIDRIQVSSYLKTPSEEKNDEEPNRLLNILRKEFQYIEEKTDEEPNQEIIKKEKVKGEFQYTLNINDNKIMEAQYTQNGSDIMASLEYTDDINEEEEDNDTSSTSSVESVKASESINNLKNKDTLNDTDQEVNNTDQAVNGTTHIINQAVNDTNQSVDGRIKAVNEPNCVESVKASESIIMEAEYTQNGSDIMANLEYTDDINEEEEEDNDTSSTSGEENVKASDQEVNNTDQLVNNTHT